LAVRLSVGVVINPPVTMEAYNSWAASDALAIHAAFVRATRAHKASVDNYRS